MSGLSHTPGKRAWGKTHRGFESRLLRQINQTPLRRGFVFLRMRWVRTPGCPDQFASCAFDPKRDDLTAKTARPVPVGTRKRFGGQRARFGSNPSGRGFAGQARPVGRAGPMGAQRAHPQRGCVTLRCKTRQAVQAYLGFCALRLIPQKPRRARRELVRASPGSLENSPGDCFRTRVARGAAPGNSRKTNFEQSRPLRRSRPRSDGRLASAPRE
jgi:hypothetical protein